MKLQGSWGAAIFEVPDEKSSVCTAHISMCFCCLFPACKVQQQRHQGLLLPCPTVGLSGPEGIQSPLRPSTRLRARGGISPGSYVLLVGGGGNVNSTDVWCEFGFIAACGKYPLVVLRGSLTLRDDSDFLLFDNKLVSCASFFSLVVWGDSLSLSSY